MNDYVKLAKQTIDEFVNSGKTIDIPKDINSELLNNKAGVFVSIHRRRKTQKNKPQTDAEKNELRGCIGTFEPTKNNIAQEIISNAITAASHDYRFAPITKDELDSLIISVDVLSEPELIEDISKLDPKVYGILLRSRNDSRSGLLLPDLKGVDTIHDQIAITLNKAGLSPKDPIDIYRFTVTRYKEE